MPNGRRFPSDVPTLVGRPWEEDADKIVQEKLLDLNAVTSGLGNLPITTKGDIVVFSTTYDRLPLGAAGLVLSSDPTTATGLSWIDVSTNLDQNILANMIFGG